MKVRADSFDITPSWPVDHGAGVRSARVDVSHPSKEPLEANLLAVWGDGESEPVLFVTLDLLYPGADVRSAVDAAAAPLSPSRIFVASSHSHRAPMTDSRKPRLGTPDRRYNEWLSLELSNRIKELIDVNLAVQAELFAGQSTAHHSIHRRRRVPWQIGRIIRRNVISIAPDPAGSVDETVVVLSLNDGQGRPIAMLWNYACHPVAHYDRFTYSAHYASWVRNEFRARNENPRLPVLFFQGFSGDTRPRDSVGFKGALGLLRTVTSGPQFRDMPKGRYERWCNSLVSFVATIPLQAVRSSHFELSSRRLYRPGTDIITGSEGEVVFQTISIGEDVTFVGVSAEVVSAYAPVCRGLTDAEYVLCVGCVDDVLGYIPTGAMVREGGYEGGGFCAEFGLGSVRSDVERNVIDAVKELML